MTTEIRKSTLKALMWDNKHFSDRGPKTIWRCKNGKYTRETCK